MFAYIKIKYKDVWNECKFWVFADLFLITYVSANHYGCVVSLYYAKLHVDILSVFFFLLCVLKKIQYMYMCYTIMLNVILLLIDFY